MRNDYCVTTEREASYLSGKRNNMPKFDLLLSGTYILVNRSLLLSFNQNQRYIIYHNNRFIQLVTSNYKFD